MEWQIKEFLGFANRPEKQDLSDGVVVDGLNWVFNSEYGEKKGVGKIEIRRGSLTYGTTTDELKKITGLSRAIKGDGTELLFRAHGRKLEYYNSTTETWDEIGTNTLPTDADGEDISMSAYQSLSGSAIYFSSPNSGFYKVMLANPTSLIDLGITDFKGHISIKNGRTILWHRLGDDGKDYTGVYGSKLDKSSYSEYTSVSSEAIGSSGSKTYTGTLAFKSSHAKANCFGVKFTDGTQNIADDFNGAFTGNGTGTINYATGEYSITFSNTTTGSVTADYLWDDPTSGGVADFSPPSDPRVAKESFILRQDDAGGEVKNVGHYAGDYFCFHEKKTWKLSISADDNTASNLPYRNNVGITYWRALEETADGIYYIDYASDKSEEVGLNYLTLSEMSSEIYPKGLSDLIDFSDYEFDKAVLKNWGDYMVLTCRTSDSTTNDRMFLYNKKFKMWSPPLSFGMSTLEVYNGALVGGDPSVHNVYKLFSGYDDDGYDFENYVTFNLTTMDIEGQKVIKRFYTEGEIQSDQTLEVYASYDRGDFILIDTISGNGSYVDKGTEIEIGKNTIGEKQIGTGDVIYANHYKKESKINSGRFREVQFKFKATGLGYVSVTAFGVPDLRYKSSKELSRYKV
jgi:hypothetical protein